MENISKESQILHALNTLAIQSNVNVRGIFKNLDETDRKTALLALQMFQNPSNIQSINSKDATKLLKTLSTLSPLKTNEADLLRDFYHYIFKPPVTSQELLDTYNVVKNSKIKAKVIQEEKKVREQEKSQGKIEVLQNLELSSLFASSHGINKDKLEKFFLENNETNQASILEFTQKLKFLSKMKADDKITCLKAFLEIPPEDRISVLQAVEQLHFLSSQSVHSLEQIIPGCLKALLEIPRNERVLLAQSANSLLTPFQAHTLGEKNLIFVVLGSLQKIPISDRMRVSLGAQVIHSKTKILKFIGQKNDLLFNCLSTLQKIPAEEQEMILKQALTFNIHVQKPDDFFKFISGLHAIAKEERESIFKFANQLNLFDRFSHSNSDIAVSNMLSCLSIIKNTLARDEISLKDLEQFALQLGLKFNQIKMPQLAEFLKLIENNPSQEERLALVNDAKKYMIELNLNNTFDIANLLNLVPASQREALFHDVVIFMKEITLEEDESIHSLLNLFKNIPPDERQKILQNMNEVKANLIDSFSDKVNYFTALLCIPENERLPLIQDFNNHKILKTLEKLSYLSNHFLTYALLPENLKAEIKAKIPAHIEKKDRIVNNKTYQEALVNSLKEKLDSQTVDPSVKLELANFVIGGQRDGSYISHNQKTLGLIDEEHPLLFQARMQAMINMGSNSPLIIYRRLIDLNKTFLEFQPKEMEVEGVKVSINMERLQQMAETSEIKREDLPKEATLEAFDTLITSLMEKIETQEAKNVLQNLNASKESVLVSVPYLKALLTSSSENVSETEAKWRFVLSSISNKSTDPKEKFFFNEQEEALVTTLIGIGNCGPKKNEGIATAYELLSPNERSQIGLSKWTSAHDMEEIENKEKSHKFITDFIAKHPGISEEKLSEELKDLIATGDREASFAANTLIKDPAKYWDILEESLTMELTAEGASLILKSPEAEKNAMQFVSQTVKSIMGSQFLGENELLQELTGTKDIHESVHSLLYMQNLIGNFVGVSNRVIYDPHTGTIPKQLLQKSKKEVLDAFFNHITPTILVEGLTQAINTSPAENKEQLKIFLQNDQFWENDGATLNNKGALALLQETGYLK